MKYSTTEQVSKFEIDFKKVEQMTVRKKVRYYKFMLDRILNGRTSSEPVKLNCGGTIYELDGENVSIFMQCYREYENAQAEVRRIKDSTPTCSINMEKIKDYSLEKKIVYFQNLMKKIENTPIGGTPCTFESDRSTRTINKKDYKTYKICRREINGCKTKLAIIKGIKERIAECKNSVLAFRDSIVNGAARTCEKTQEVVNTIRDAGPSSVKRGISFALSMGFVGNMALETVSDEVKINRDALLNLETVTMIESEKESDIEIHTIEVGDKVVVLDEKIDIPNEVVPIDVNDEEELLDFFEASSIQYKTIPKEEFVNVTRMSIQGEPQLSPEEQRAALIDSYFEEYCLYFNLDKDKVIDIARCVTNDYEVDFSSVIANLIKSNKYNLSDDEAGVMGFVYLLQRGRLSKGLKALGISTSNIKISDEVYGSGREKGTEIILRNGETEKQFLVRLCKLLGTDENYCLAISMYETHDKEAGPFQSVMCRNKNNYGGLRGTGEFMTFPSPEAGIIAFCVNLKGYERYQIHSLETLSRIYVNGSRKADPSEVWIKNVRGFYKQIAENYEEYTGYPEEQEVEKVPVLELY